MSLVVKNEKAANFGGFFVEEIFLIGFQIP